MNILVAPPEDRAAIFSSKVVECGCDSPTCEGSLYAFEITEVIAEFVSTLTMIPLLITGIWCYLHARGLYMRFMALTVAAVGVAGLWYHASLSWWGQVFDRMMCIWFFASALKCTRHVAADGCLPYASKRHILAMDIMSHVLVIASLPSSIIGLHGIVYMAGLLASLFLILPLHAEFKKMEVYRSFLMGALKLFALALVCFVVDDLLLANASCSIFPFFHSIWHVLSAVGLHKALVYSQYVELYWRGERSHRIHYKLFVLPYVAHSRAHSHKYRDTQGPPLCTAAKLLEDLKCSLRNSARR